MRDSEKTQPQKCFWGFLGCHLQFQNNPLFMKDADTLDIQNICKFSGGKSGKIQENQTMKPELWTPQIMFRGGDNSGRKV